MAFEIEDGILTEYIAEPGETHVVVPDEVDTIECGAFSYAREMKSIDLPCGVDICEGAFKGCVGLADQQGFVIVEGILFDYIGTNGVVTIPDHVDRISQHAFSDCETVWQIFVPNSVSTLDYGAFERCKSLREVYFMENGIEVIEWDTFAHCPSLELVSLPASVKEIDEKAFSHSYRWKIRAPMGSEAERFAKAQGRLDLSEEIPQKNEGSASPSEDADENGFVIVGGVLVHYLGDMRTVNIPEGVTEIQSGAFGRACLAEKIIVPASVVKIAEDAFQTQKGIKLYVEKGSYAMVYAIDHDMPFQVF